MKRLKRTLRNLNDRLRVRVREWINDPTWIERAGLRYEEIVNGSQAQHIQFGALQAIYQEFPFSDPDFRQLFKWLDDRGVVHPWQTQEIKMTWGTSQKKGWEASPSDLFALAAQEGVKLGSHPRAVLDLLSLPIVEEVEETMEKVREGKIERPPYINDIHLKDPA